MSTRTLSGSGRTLLMCADIRVAVLVCVALVIPGGHRRCESMDLLVGCLGEADPSTSRPLCGRSARDDRCGIASRALRQRHERTVLGADVVGAGTDDLVVEALLDHVCRPAGGAGDHEQR